MRNKRGGCGKQPPPTPKPPPTTEPPPTKPPPTPPTPTPTPEPGRLKVNIEPSGARDDGAMWKNYEGNWNESG